MKIQTMPTTPSLRAGQPPQPEGEKKADSFERTGLGQALDNLPSFARGAALGLGTVSPPLLGGVAGGLPGALAGGAAAFGFQYSLDQNPGRALSAAAGPTLLGGLLGLSSVAPSALRIAGAVGIGVLAGVAAVVRQDLEERATRESGPIQHINKPGQKVDIEDHLVPGKVNIVDFSADWCPACQDIKPGLESYVNKNSEGTVLLNVDIKEWKSPVCDQFGIRKIPMYRIYDGEGTLMSEGDAARAQVDAWAAAKG